MAQSGRTFLVECYLPGVAESDVAAAGERARRVADELRAKGRDVAYLGALFVAADEAVFHQFRARNANLVVEASRLADLPFERVVESIGVDGGGSLVSEVDGARALKSKGRSESRRRTRLPASSVKGEM
jgi:hypothetical protein